MRLILFLLSINIFFSLISLEALEIDYNVSNNYDNVFNKKILSEKDVELYQKIFTVQKDCKWRLANKYLFELENSLLVGHVLAQRYLHPKCYKSKFQELSSWLKMYSDQKQAGKIHRLAVKRMPQGYKRPRSPQPAIGVAEDMKTKNKVSKKYEGGLKLNKVGRNERYRLLTNIKSRVNKGWPTGALKLLIQKQTKKLLDSVEIDQQKELIAKGYFLAKKNNLAVKYANEALMRSPDYVPFANWTAGLATWKLGKYEQAAIFFSNFAIALKNDPWHESSGSFWAARSFAKTQNYKEINFWLTIAANNPETFYGQLANSILGTEKPIDWADEKIQPEAEKIFINLPAGKRIMALIQVGRIDEAEGEIIKLNQNINKSVALASLSVASQFNFAQTQLKIAYRLESFGQDIPIKYYYPVPPWIPSSGYIIDKSLIFAFIHQESTFNQNAKSKKGAIGLMQLMPSTAKFISKNKKVKRGNSNVLKDPLTNIEVGQEYILYLLSLQNIENNLVYMAAAYNGGPGNLQKWIDETNHKNDSLLFMESIPSRETRWFIEKILTKYWIYQNRFKIESKSLLELAKGNDPVYSLNMD